MWSEHIIDGETIVLHAFPELELLHEKNVSWIRRQITTHPIPRKKSKNVAEEINGTSSLTTTTFQPELYGPQRLS